MSGGTRPTWFAQYRVMMWKTLLLKKRNPGAWFWEFLSPMMYVGILVGIKAGLTLSPNAQFGGFPEYPLGGAVFSSQRSAAHVLVTPNNAYIQTIMNGVVTKYQTLTGTTLIPVYFANRSSAESEFLKNDSVVFAGVEFNFENKGNLTYAIRFKEGVVPGTDMYADQGSCRNDQKSGKTTQLGLQNDDFCKVNKYLFSGFAELETAIDAALVEHEFGVTFNMQNVLVQMLPKPAWQADSSYLQMMSSLYFVLAFLPLVGMFTGTLVTEKQLKVKEGMKMMGLRNSVFWMSWFTMFFFQILTVTILVVILVTATKFFGNSNMFLMFLLWVFYGLSMVGVACLLSPFFDKAMKAGTVASISTMLVSCLYLVVSLTRTYEQGTGSASYTIPVYGRWLLCLISPVALALGMDQAIYLDVRDGLDFTTASAGDFPFYGPLLMLLADTILYSILAVYFDNVIPGEYGPREKPGFFLRKSYWFPETRRTNSVTASYDNFSVNIVADNSGDDQNPNIEAMPSDMQSKAAVKIHRLTKVFKNKEKGKENLKAVNDLSLTMYEDQITAILGHNGAGKTTLMNILTGLSSATSGHATIKGLDVTDPHDVATLRSMTGVCPQYNLLFEKVTCYEHLFLFAGIKGVTGDVDKHIDEALSNVDLLDQKNTRSENLSGGQKRKLCVAIAIIGDPKIIFLDEPTAGMDPYSRRHLWRCLQEKKQGRIILLTTHFMDEADILADRKAIVNKGRLQCCGSSFFLKNKFGIGYHLNMVVEPNCDTDRVASLVSGVVPGSEVNRVHGKELDITMPQTAVDNFAPLFSKLEDPSTAQSLGVKNFGVSMTTLEEVFLKLEEDADQIELHEVDERQLTDKLKLLPSPRDYGSSTVDVNSGANPSDSVDCVAGKTLMWQRFQALYMIHFKNHLRSKAAHIIQVFLPVVFIIIGLVLGKTLQPDFSGGISQQASLRITPVYYTKMNPSLGIGQYFPYNTVPHLLMKDAANNTASQQMISGLAPFYEMLNLSDAYFLDMYRLLEKGVAPHYLGVQLNSLTVTAPSTLTCDYKVWYNDSAVSSVPATVNLMNNALLKAALALISSTDNRTLETYSYPWPNDKVKTNVYDSGAFASVLLVGMAFAFVASGFGVDVVKQRELKIRSQLRVTGLPFTLYWGSMFAVHFTKFMIPCILTIIVILAAQLDSMKTGGAIFAFILVCLFYVPANIFFSYVFSYLFTKWETCMNVQPQVYYILGMVPYIPVSIMDMILIDSQIPMIIHHVVCVIDPVYHVFGGMYYISRVYTRANIFGTVDQISFSDYFTYSSNIPIVLIMGCVHVFLCFFLLRVLDIYKTEGDVREACCPGRQDRSAETVVNHDVIANEDDDVHAERERVRELARRNAQEMPVAMVEDLRKEFKKPSKETKWVGCRRVPQSEKVKPAVRNQTFAVEAGEVFGLLGPNGAGKTTTLNMMIADIGPDCGRVMVGGYNIRSNMSDAFQTVGYCPQHDALWEDITLKEHLVCYAKIRGIPPNKQDSVIDFFLDNLKLLEHQDKAASTLSGGTKRKLSYCMAMMGRPKIVLLDEPSTGMDPQSKRFLWDTISASFQNSERGAILTTHYMEEADALCSRIAIMVNGKMMCLGSSQHLKHKFGSGYTLEIKVKSCEDKELLDQRVTQLNDYVRTMFPQVVVVEQFGERVQYKVPKSNVMSLSKTFTVLENGKKDYQIAEYSFSQSTLEQVFLEFARDQLEEGQDEEEIEKERARSVHRAMSVEAGPDSPSPSSPPRNGKTASPRHGTRVSPTNVVAPELDTDTTPTQLNQQSVYL